VGYPVLSHPESIRFRYKLDGHDATWLETGTRAIEYQKLSGGNYTFRYQVSHDGQHWRDGHTSPRVHIALVFWRHPLFISSGLLLFLLSIFSWHRIRIHRLNKQQALETQFNQKLAAMEMSVLRAQMNPHFMFNSLNSIKNYILKKKTEEASSYLTKFSQLMRAVLQNSQSTLIPLHEELKALSLYIELEALRFEGEFEWKIMVDPSLNSETLAVPPLLIQPYVENAIRHGLLEKESGSRELCILIAPLKADVLSITIQDNGIGRTQSARRQQHVRRNRSYGMQITSDRIALIMKTLGILATVHVEDLYHTDGSPAGTKVEIQIPQLSATKGNGLTHDTVTNSNYAEDDIDR
jgi:LytS/YehU family sensor histidine kinase